MNRNILGLDQRLLNAISELGFTDLTEIQQKAIPLLLTGDRDFVGLAQTGTGKTAAFGLPLIQLIDTKKLLFKHLFCVQLVSYVYKLLKN